MDTGYIWLIVSVVLFALEAFGLPGVGFLFAAIGALITGISIRLEFIAADAYVIQGVLFFAFTALSAALLWKPMQKMRIRVKQKPTYDSLLGANATVHQQPLSKHKEGQVVWSGTILAAELAHDAPIDEVQAGERVSIVDVRGALVIVRPK